ncbi:MAG: uncharacterized protein K0S63_722 [Gammaproteobacteria bacterium]|jgi:Ser/Thr protein kinase RdoA (MazF antagonist)|nr:uncharacterized protein [Gammaproteobacteria bacterium]
MKDNSIDLYQQRLKLQGATFLRIEHDDAMVAVVFKVLQPRSAPLILKICSRPGDYLREVYFLKRLSGALPVPRIQQLIEPEPDLHGAILMECLPGALLKKADFTEALVHEIGSCLAQIHLNCMPAYGDLTQADNLSVDPRVHFTLRFEESLSECSNELPMKLLQQCQDYYDEHINLLASVDGPCIIHRDFRPGNIMIHNGKLQGIIDWASGRAGFAEEDFCPIGLGEWGFTPVYKKYFLEAYASVRPVPKYDPIMPLLRLSRAVAAVGFTIKYKTWKSRHARFYQINRQVIESFF